MISKTQIELALQNKSITDYLAARGFSPETTTGVRWKYLCPFPDHQETKPSFVVFKNEEIEKFWCFGCSRGISLVQLMMGLEGLTYPQALKKIIPDSQFTSDDEIKAILSQIEKFKDDITPDADIGTLLMNISRMCLTYSHKTNNDPKEVAILDRFYCQLDKDIIDLNIDNLERYLFVLPKILCQRKDIYKHNKFLERKKEFKHESTISLEA